MKDSKDAGTFPTPRALLVVFVACAGLASRGALGVTCDAPGASPDAPRLESVVPAPVESDASPAWEVSWPARGLRPLAAVDTPTVGGLVRVLRCLPPGRWAPVGEGRVARINGHLAEATIVLDPSHTDASPFGTAHPLLGLRGNLFPRPMAGDLVVPVLAEIRLRPRVNPRIELDARDLFDATGEVLTDEGREHLTKALERFATASGRLLVEAHVRAPGNRTGLRRLSQLRADAVAQFAMREMGLEADRVVSLGFGSDGLSPDATEIPAWPARALEESVVLRVLPSFSPAPRAAK